MKFRRSLFKRHFLKVITFLYMFGLIGKTKQNSHPFFQLESFLFFSSCSGEIFISAEISFESILLFMMRNDWVRVDGNFATKLLTPDRVRISLEAGTCEICSKMKSDFQTFRYLFSLTFLVFFSFLSRKRFRWRGVYFLSFSFKPQNILNVVRNQRFYPVI